MAESDRPRKGIFAGITSGISDIAGTATRSLNLERVSDPFGVCGSDLGLGFKVCNNIEQSKGIKQIILTVIAIGLVFIGDFFDIFSWVIGLIPVVGDLLGNSGFGNIVDAITLLFLVWLIGGFALIGIGEFVDLLGFIPVIGDIAAVLEWLPAWLFALVIYGIYLLLKSRNITPQPGASGSAFKNTGIKPSIRAI